MKSSVSQPGKSARVPRSATVRCAAVLASVVLCSAHVARAQATDTQSTTALEPELANEVTQYQRVALAAARALAADADAAVFGMAYRGSVRAQLGAFLPVIGDEATDGFNFGLAPLVELHEPLHSLQPLPSEYWRARLPVEASWGFGAAAARYRVGLALEHESDHESSHAYSKAGFLTLNDAALVLRTGLRLGALQLFTAARLRGYVVSCTRTRSTCENFRGDASAGAQLDLVLLGPSLGRTRLSPFAAVTGFGLLAHAGIGGETHLELHAGVTIPTRWLEVQSFALLYVGNDVGLLRALTVTQLGAAVRLPFAQRP
ncbi:MAG TPA: hypothetical protein VF331_12695 [Polyangiales bacterium]